MSHFAKVENNIVTSVIRAEQDFINNGALGNPSLWKQCSYNTYGGVHYVAGSDPKVPSEDQSKALRKNYPGIGFTYDSTRDAFIPPKLFQSWLLDENTCLWIPPVPRPEDGKEYDWDEANIRWIEFIE
jgi:hypothetical protein